MNSAQPAFEVRKYCCKPFGIQSHSFSFYKSLAIECFIPFSAQEKIFVQ